VANHRQRITALQALVAGSALGALPVAATIQNEFEQVALSGRVRILNRRFILQILHSTRALDSALRSFVLHHAIPNGGNSLGGYLHALVHHLLPHLNTLPAARRLHFQNQIVAIRNRYLHEAGTFPANDQALATLVGEMEACLTEVFSL
jgi:hypothetical protein